MCSNIEDISRDAGSMDVEEDVLLRECGLTFLDFYLCSVLASKCLMSAFLYI